MLETRTHSKGPPAHPSHNIKHTDTLCPALHVTQTLAHCTIRARERTNAALLGTFDGWEEGVALVLLVDACDEHLLAQGQLQSLGIDLPQRQCWRTLLGIRACLLT